ncbi:MAG: hypothetical protein ABIN80_09845 [Dyadobacter sp.]|uniref:hypothetical protein n=1 Tax=Dyadobacter sp. TaxID=1914288 RepID=UPI003264F896
MQYYLAGYFLIRQEPVLYFGEQLRTINTASSCFNEHLLASWCFYLRSEEEEAEIEQSLMLGPGKIDKIRNWVEHARNAELLGVHNVFFDLETLQKYKSKFFSHLPDLKIVAIYLTKPFLTSLIAAAEPAAQYQMSGIYQLAKRWVPEQKHDQETLLGFDMIGIEPGGAFHTFYCHGGDGYRIGDFDLRINQYGLFDDYEDWETVMKYANEYATFEPVPWVVCKVKLIN